MRKLLLIGILFFAHFSEVCAQGAYGLMFNQSWAFGPNGAHAFKIATLMPSGNAGSYDHIHLVATFNVNDDSSNNALIDAEFGNRNGFSYHYTVRGALINPASRLTAYRNSDGTVDIYMMFASAYVVGGYTVLENVQETLYTTFTDLGSATPSGTLVFDSSSPSYPSQSYLDFGGNLYSLGKLSIGTSVTNPTAGSLLASRGGGQIMQEGTTAPGDQKLWDSLVAAPATLVFRAVNDANNAATNWLEVTRSGYQISSVSFPHGNMSVAGALSAGALNVAGALTASGGISFANSVGVGTATPGTWSGILDANGSNLQLFGNGSNSRVVINSTLNDAAELHLIDGAAAQDHHNHRFFADNSGLVLDQPNDNYGVTTLNMFWANNGNVGIGTTSPSAKLEVNGNVKLSSANSSITFSDNSVQSIAWNGILPSGDYAESVDVTGDRSEYGPGDVLVIDASSPGKFLKSTIPYSTSVAGIYSTKPGVIGRRQTTEKSHMKDEVPMAMVGIVPTKVTTEGGPIKPGDLLVTSSRSGYAMKGTDRSQLVGAIVGKALGTLDAGTGVIEVAVSLQ